MGQIKVEKNVGGIEGLCVIEPAVHGDYPRPFGRYLWFIPDRQHEYCPDGIGTAADR